ncbi:MAG: peptidase M16 [Hyphomicrobium sp.]|nr:peptidase M16 [Hyphomicrobium sp.]PPC81785.1 MAG: peptidase M16 [Hyphomicrobium sp.]
MTVEITTLSNGMRVVTDRMAHLETTSLGVWVAAGARHETEAETGISHLLEHMAFKGTARRSARQIAEEIEAVGGELNAATGLEHTAYYARVLKGDEGTALDILADILLNSSYAEDELEREREVILQEIAMIQDSPEEIVYDLMHDAAYPNQPAGRPIIGTPDSVKRITVGDLRDFLAARYVPGQMIVSAAGAVDHDRLVRHVEALFGGLISANVADDLRASYSGGTRVSTKLFEQSHLLLAFEGPSYRDPDMYTAQVFSGLFGGGMSSRLFQEVRERRGLCYSIYSSAWGLDDTGLFGVHAATGPGMMAELIDVVGKEFQEIAANGPADAEIGRSKAQLKAGLLMALESSSARAEQMARHLLIHGRLVPPSELVAAVEVVSAEGIAAFAARLVAGKPAVALVGAGKKSADLARRAEAMARN